MCWLDGTDEKTADLLSYIPLVVEKEIECRLGDTGLDVLVGDTDAERIGGEPGGVNRGVVVWDASNRPCAIRGLEATKVKKYYI